MPLTRSPNIACLAQYDNFYIRILGGPDVYQLPAGGVRRRHLELAKKRLANFSVVMTHDGMSRHISQVSLLPVAHPVATHGAIYCANLCERHSSPPDWDGRNSS